MPQGWFITDALFVLCGAAVVLGFAAMFKARGVVARTDAAAAVGLALVVVSGGLGWVGLAQGPSEGVLAVIFAWFVAGAFYRLGRPASAGRFPSIYGAVVTALSGWIVLSAANGGGLFGHPGRELGVILVDLAAALLMFFAAVGWLLSSFAVPTGSKAHAVEPLTGTREAMLAAGLAVALYAIA